MKKNKGYSLVEIVVVIAIIAVLTVGGALGIAFVSGRQAEKTAQSIAVILREAAAMSMTKYELAVIIQKTSEGDIEVIQSIKTLEDSEPEYTSTKVGDSNVIISYETSSALQELSTGNSLTIYFDRKTGGFAPAPGTSDYCEKIYVTRSETRKTITLTPKTGKISIE